MYEARFSVTNFKAELADLLNQDRKVEQQFCDVTIQARKRRHAAHKAVLAMRSPYFKNLFSVEMCEKYAEVSMDMDDDKLEYILEFCYVGVVEITRDNVLDILEGSDYVQLQDLKAICGSFMKKNIDAENCLKTREYALQYNLDEVVDKTYEVIEENLATVIQQDAFKQLTVEDLMVVTNINRIKANEEVVYTAIILWVKFQPTIRNQLFVNLFSKLDVSHFSQSFLCDTVTAENLVQQNHGFCKLVMNAIAEKRHAIKFLIVGGERSTSNCILYDITNFEEETLPELHDGRAKATSVMLGNKVFSIGGGFTSELRKNLKSVEMFDLDNRTEWIQKADLPSDRYFAASAVMNGFIYVSGGVHFSYNSCLSSCYVYNVDIDTWNEAPEMLHERRDHAMVELEGFLYCIGGHDGSSRLKVCERFDGEDWLEIAPMLEPRDELAAVACRGHIYAIGGVCGAFIWDCGVASVERYDPKINQWSQISSMNVARRSHGAFESRGKIYVVGGYNETSVEVYDPSCDKWYICFDMGVSTTFCNVVGVST